jgi:hypothetical protein
MSGGKEPRVRQAARTSRIAIAAVAALLLPAVAVAGPVELTYLYDLSDFTGVIPYSDARVVVDPSHSEVYMLYGNEVRVFNDSGMEIYRFQLDFSIGRIVDLAAGSSGDLVMLIYDASGGGRTRWWLERTDFRGRPAGEIPLERTGDAAEMLPTRVLLRAERTWLISQSQMLAACYQPDGKLERVLDLAGLAGIPPDERANAEVSGLDIGADGTVVFAVPVQFMVHALDPGGAVRSFGRSGSAAGNFGVLGDVALDGEGNIFVSDRQRSVVMSFTRDFQFLREAGRISGGAWLARPGTLAFDPAGRLYVSQVRDRGVAVFTTGPRPEPRNDTARP